MDKDIIIIPKPAITVFIAAYNAAEFIKESIESVLTQTFTDFELLIIDDGSTDETKSIVNSIKDNRIRIISNEENKGIAFTRNRGLDEAQGEYIAILDSDDICLPERLFFQYNFLNQHSEIALCGGQAYLINENGKDIGYYPYIPSGRDLGMNLLFRNVFINPSCMFRKSVAKKLGGYRDYSPAEDYDLFVRVSLGYKVANLENYLIKYRFHENNISETSSHIVRDQERRILKQVHEYLKINDLSLLDTHHAIYLKQYDAIDLEKAYNLLSACLIANNEYKVYEKKLFKEFIFGVWKELILNVRDKNKPLLWYFKKGLFSFELFNIKDFLKIVFS